ncbi:unnamed protein product, partial [marine sediment metagenome]
TYTHGSPDALDLAASVENKHRLVSTTYNYYCRTLFLPPRALLALAQHVSTPI